MREFRVLEHTADVGFEAFGATREEVFRNAGRALMSIMIDLDSVAPRERVLISARAREPAGLLVNWLSEIVYLYDGERWLFRDFEIGAAKEGFELTDSKLNNPEPSVEAAGIGERFDPGRHQIRLLVKAITYHQLALERTAEGHWRARVYVDI